MRLNRDRRIASLRWPSRDHRDYQTPGRRWPWRSRDAERGPEERLRSRQPVVSSPLALSRIVEMRTGEACVQLEIVTHPAFPSNGEAAINRAIADAPSDATARGSVASPVDNASSCTMTLMLN